jgi:hypothetical protein
VDPCTTIVLFFILLLLLARYARGMRVPPMVAGPFLMWGYQPHFHAVASDRAQELFRKLDDRLHPRVILVGIRLDDVPGVPVVSVYPEGTGYATEIFAGAEAGAAMLRQMHRERPLYLSDDSPARRARRLAQIGVMKNAIRDAVDAHSDPAQVLTYVGRPRLVDHYLVTVVLQLHRPAYNALPHLERAVIEDIYAVPVSLVQTTAEKFIDVCIDLLSTHNLEAMAVQWPDIDEMLRTAGIRFMATAEAAGRNSQGLYTLFRGANAISSQKYEGEVKPGSLLIARRGHDHVDVQIELPHPVHLGDHRASRKLLQMCSDTISLLADSVQIYGLGTVRDTYDPADESVFEVRFTKHFTWQFCHYGTALMEVAYGEPRFPRPLFDAARFRMTLAQVIPGIAAPVVNRLCERAQEASEQKHGTMLVITPQAAQEAERLRNESTLVAPVALGEATLKPVTEIDGAVLLDDQGVCHAVGVILDGRASPHGTPARGARYNSAIRYVDGLGAPCVAVIVSEDGTVDLYPPRPGGQ